ncbi:MAG: HAD family hydrolase [Desulfobacterales bacterium]|jgi:HAD superfamily hydrolase (TIGR01509 family)
MNVRPKASPEIRVVAFDCDGVMFDSADANRAFYNDILRRMGKGEMTPAQFAYTHMHAVQDSIAHLFPDPAEQSQAHACRMGIKYDQFIPIMQMAPYLKPLLQNLRRHFKTAVATNRTDSMPRVMSDHGLEGYFDLVVSAADVRRPKPDPEPLLKILEHFEVSPREMIYVGDSEVDRLAAAAAGIPLVAYRNRELAADFHVEDMKALEALLLNGGPGR